MSRKMKYIEVKINDENAIVKMSFLATEIVRDYYEPILGKAQNEYMLEKFQSVRAIKEQLLSGYRYFFIAEESPNETPLGFFAVYNRKDALYLSKFYLYADKRNKGYGKKTLNFIKSLAEKENLGAIELNVNRKNYPSVAAYEKMGFALYREEKNDIGSGYYMDDFVYRLEI